MNLPVVRSQAAPSLDQLELARDLTKRRLWVAIRKAIKAGKVSQADLARALGVKPSTISRMLRHPSNLTISRASDLARVSGHFISVGVDAVEPTKHSVEVRAATQSNFFEYQNNQPGNLWNIRFERAEERISVPAGRFQNKLMQGAMPGTAVNQLRVALDVD